MTMSNEEVYYTSNNVNKVFGNEAILEEFINDEHTLLSLTNVYDPSSGPVSNQRDLTEIDFISNPYESYKTSVACHHNDCHTKKNYQLCIFPFVYKNRKYTSCITIDSTYPWCSLKVDKNGIHINEDKYKGQCNDDCFVQNCPVGFFDLNRNCMHMSAKTNNDLVSTLEQADNACLEMGSRLYQPRDIKTFKDFLKNDISLFENVFYNFPNTLPHLILLGAVVIANNETNEIYYNDGSRAYFLEKITQFQESTNLQCVYLSTHGKVVSSSCDMNDTLTGYICEAKNVITDNGEVCQFPFYESNNSTTLYHSCIYNLTERYSWCYTQLDKNGFGISGKEGKCSDEREITYDGPGSGHNCIIPFLFDRIWYDSCILYPQEEFWCPTKLNNMNRLFNDETDEYGYCTEYLRDKKSVCNDNYEPVNGLCIRVSPFPEKFDDALSKCQSEGASLLEVLDIKTSMSILEHIENISITKSYFLPPFSVDINDYWVGGIVSNYTWKWESSGKNFSQFSNWLANTENIGCGEFCTKSFGLTVKVHENLQWMANKKNIEKPYICESKCKVGYLWFNHTQKCLKIYSDKYNLENALFKCSHENARLIKPDSCQTFNNLKVDLKRMQMELDGRYWLGVYSDILHQHNLNRISNSALNSGILIKSDGYAFDHSCDKQLHFTDDVNEARRDAMMGVINANIESIKYSLVQSDFSDVEFGLICEQDNDWECPKDYFLFHESCYKLIDQSATFSNAVLACNKENGMLTSVSTLYHMMFINKIIQEFHTEELVWIGYKKVTENEKVVHFETNSILPINTFSGKDIHVNSFYSGIIYSIISF